MRLDAWIGDTLTRIYPRTEKGTKKTLRLYAARGERVSFQVCLRRDAGASDMPVKAAVSVTAPDGIAVRVRRVGYVPQRHFNTQTPFDELDGVGHVPGLVPDPLFDESEVLLPAGETHAFWLTVSVPENATPGHYAIPVEITGDTLRPKQLAASLFVSNVVLAPRKNFHMLHWFYADAICDWYKVKPFEKAFWPIVEAYMRNYAEHDNDIIYLPVFTPPLDGVKRPTQLLKVARKPGGKYAFDWTDVKKWVEASRRCGIGKFEWTHWFSQWGVKHALRIYEEQDGEDVLLWPPDTGATSRVYRNYLAQFLPSLKTFLAREGLMDKSFFHVSDEPHGEENRRNYIAARNLLQELAPWMKVMDALSEIEYGRERIDGHARADASRLPGNSTRKASRAGVTSAAGREAGI